MTIEKTITIAVAAHNGQKDLDGRPAILHPLAVALKGNTDAEKMKELERINTKHGRTLELFHHME